MKFSCSLQQILTTPSGSAKEMVQVPPCWRKSTATYFQGGKSVAEGFFWIATNEIVGDRRNPQTDHFDRKSLDTVLALPLVYQW